MDLDMPAPMTGKVTPPADLQPAIDALGSKGKSYLKGLSQGKIEPWMIAQAADHENYGKS